MLAEGRHEFMLRLPLDLFDRLEREAARKNIPITTLIVGHMSKVVGDREVEVKGQLKEFDIKEFDIEGGVLASLEAERVRLDAEWQELVNPFIYKKDEAGRQVFNNVGLRAVIDFKLTIKELAGLDYRTKPWPGVEVELLRLCIQEAKKGELAKFYEKNVVEVEAKSKGFSLTYPVFVEAVARDGDLKARWEALKLQPSNSNINILASFTCFDMNPPRLFLNASDVKAFLKEEGVDIKDG